MATPSWIQNTEKVVGENHISLDDVANRPAKTIHSNFIVEHLASGLHTGPVVLAAANIAANAITVGDDGAKGVKGSTALISAAGEMTNPSQPSFLAIVSATISDVTGDGTAYTVVFGTEIFDQGADFDGTSTFTAPVTGKYLLVTNIYLTGLAASDIISLQITTSNRPYTSTIGYNTYSNEVISYSVVADMDAADTAYVVIAVSGGTKDVDVSGAATSHTNFSGALIC